MTALKTVTGMAALGFVLAAAPGFAQATGAPPTTPPAQTTQKPTPPPAATAPVPEAPRPFPEGAKVAYISIQFIANTSVEGKAATAKLDALKKKKNDELVAKGTQLKAAQDKLQSGGTVMSDQARGQLEKEIERMQRDLQYAQQDAQQEVQETTDQLQGEFQMKLTPIIEALRAEKGLWMIFAPEGAVVAADPGLDLSAEVVKRFDAAAKTAPKK